MKTAEHKRIIIILLAAALTLCACTSSLDFSESATEGAWTAALYPEGMIAFAKYYEWDGTDEGLRMEPGSVNGCMITKYGGFFGRGLPEPFYLRIPNAYSIDESEIPEGTEVEELEFTMVVSNAITDIFSNDLPGYFYAKYDSGEEKYYFVSINVELAPDNSNFRMENGKLYAKGEDTPVAGLYYEPKPVSENKAE